MRNLPSALNERLINAVEDFAEKGAGDVKRLEGQDAYRLRVGSWRIIFEIVNWRIVRVLRVHKRGDAY